MNPALQQILTIVGVLLGSGATFVATSLVERSRWRRTQSSRWDDKRLAAYSDYANSVKAAARICQKIAVGKGILAGAQSIDYEAGLEALTDIGNERAVNWEPVLLLGEPATIKAAQAWAATVWELEHLIRSADLDGDKFVAAYKESVRHRNVFYASARQDLGVGLGDLPDPNFPQFRLAERSDSSTGEQQRQ